MALVVRRIYAPAVVLPDLLGKEIKKALATVQKKKLRAMTMCNLISIGLLDSLACVLVF